MERYKKLLSDHLRFIHKSAMEFDKGASNEALRIATSLRVIFHQTKYSTALLEHLNAWNIRLRTETETMLKDLPVPLQMISPNLSEDGKYYRFIPSNNNEYLSVKDWWDEYPVTAMNEKWISRRDIVLWVCNKDGGVHVDTALPDLYTKSMTCVDIIKRDKITGEELSRKPIETPINKLRQFAYEVVTSPELIALTK